MVQVVRVHILHGYGRIGGHMRLRIGVITYVCVCIHARARGVAEHAYYTHTSYA